MGIIAVFAMWNFIDSIDMALCHSKMHRNEISVKNQFQWINIAVDKQNHAQKCLVHDLESVPWQRFWGSFKMWQKISINKNADWGV